jgi:putative membrane protein
MKLLSISTACVCALTMAVAVPVAGAQSSRVPSKDATWLKDSIQIDYAEIQAGKLAETKTNNATIMKFAKTMVSDHTQMLKSAEALAHQENIAVPTGPSSTQLAQANSLKTRKGPEFNIYYAKAQITGHNLAISETKTEISSGTDSAIQAAARSALPMLEQHLRLAKAALAATSAM